jgi:hypothetical protein
VRRAIWTGLSEYRIEKCKVTPFSAKLWIKVCNVDFLPIWVNKNCETESALIKKSPEVGNNGADPILT